MNKEKYEVLLRLKAIEIIAYWEGRLITNQITDNFGISRLQASKDISRYNTTYNPDALTYSPSVKGYVPNADFLPVLTKGHINEYMELMSGLVSQSSSATWFMDYNISAVQMPDRAVRPEVVREIIKACRQKLAVKIIYASMNNPVWHERIISPHTIVYTGFRWHVRAYCHSKSEYRDFLLSRIDRKPRLIEELYHGQEQDHDWLKESEIKIIPNENLTEEQKSLVEKDYGMADGRLTLNVPNALIHYTLQRYQVALTEAEMGMPRQYPLQLMASNRKLLRDFLFDSAKENGD